MVCTLNAGSKRIVRAPKADPSLPPFQPFTATPDRESVASIQEAWEKSSAVLSTKNHKKMMNYSNYANRMLNDRLNPNKVPVTLGSSTKVQMKILSGEIQHSTDQLIWDGQNSSSSIDPLVVNQRSSMDNEYKNVSKTSI